MTRPTLATCPECQRTVHLLVDGILRNHPIEGRRAHGTAPLCPGSGKPPKT